MPTISDLQTSFTQVNAFLQSHPHVSIPEFQRLWAEIFDSSISSASAECFLRYYRDMYRGKSYKGGKRSQRVSRKKTQRRAKRSMKRTRTRGGFLTGAPLTSTMGPGANVAVYGRFPTEIATDGSSIQNLDVFYQSGLSQGCGTENTSRTVPPAMGTNKVGGKRKTRRSHRRSGGGMLESAAMRPYLASPYPNPIQQGYEIWSGNPQPIPAPASPVSPTWNFSKADVSGIIDPGHISVIANDLSKLASPAPWQTSYASV
jgi:hypothetical protein